MTGPASTLPRLAAAAVAVLATAGPLGAQYSSVPEPAAYALRGVTVVAADGRRTSGVTLVVRDGRIAAMGPNATVPAGARVLEGDSLVVYPGFVDAQGSAKFTFPAPEIDRSTVESWNPPRVLQGYTPHRRVMDVLQATGSDLADQRKAGVVLAAVHPELALMAGQGTLIALRPHATSPAELVVTPSVGTLLSFRGGRGVYPGTQFATTAFLRQTFEDAKRARAIQAAHARNPDRVPLPANDPDMAVVQEIVAGEEPVYFVANDGEEIRYALALGEQYGFKPVIVGGNEAYEMADELRRRDVPVLVSLDFGRPRRWKPPTGSDSAARPSGPSAVADPAILREQQEFEERYANAGKLAAAGVRVALTSGGGKANLRDGARTAIRYGMREADALRALTATPAALLGVERRIALAPGAPANFVVTDGNLFDEQTRIVYTFVEGSLERGSSEARRPAAATAAAGGAGAQAVAGRYSVELASAQGNLSGTMTLTGDASAFSGSIDTEMGQLPIRNGKLQDGTLTFSIVFPFMQNMELPVSAPLQNGAFSATANTPVGEAKITGRKLDPQAHDDADDEDYELLWEGHSHGPRPASKKPAGGAGSQEIR